MKYVVIAPVGDMMDSLYVGIREFPTERIILITPKDKLADAQEAKDNLEKFKIHVQIKETDGKWEDLFRAVAEIVSVEKGKELIVNVATGTRDSRCAMTSAAFVHGLKAFAVENDKAVLLPVMKFSYYKILSEKKLELLKIIEQKDCCASLEELSKRSSMSLPLVSYHVNGNLRSEGLKDLGLVETKDARGRVEVLLTPLGKMLLKGYV